MEELQAQIDAMKIEIEQLKVENAFCIDQVKKHLKDWADKQKIVIELLELAKNKIEHSGDPHE